MPHLWEEAMTRRGTSRITSLGVSLILALATVVIGTGPAAAEQDTASDVPTSLRVTDLQPSMVAGPGDVDDVQDADEPITFDDLRQLVAQLYDDGQITRYGEYQLRFNLGAAERIYNGLGCVNDYFISYMERFKQVASDPRYVLTESAREELVAAADQLIVQLCGTTEASG